MPIKKESRLSAGLFKELWESGINSLLQYAASGDYLPV
jgi:hypothetical protein